MKKNKKTEVIRLTQNEKDFIQKYRDFASSSTEPEVKVEYIETNHNDVYFFI